MIYMGGMIIMNTYIGCSVIIYDDKNRVLVSQRSSIKKKFPLQWETIGGALEGTETPDECIRREVKEEINCNIHDLKLFNVYVINDDNRYVLIVYTGKINEEVHFNPEIEQVRWINRSEIEELSFCCNDHEKLSDYFNRKYYKNIK